MIGYREAFLNALDGVTYLADADGRILAVGQPGWTTAFRNHGYEAGSNDNFVGRTLFEAIRSADVAAAYRTVHDAVLKGDRPHVAFEMRCDAADVRRVLRMSISALREPDRPPAVLYQSQVLSAVARPWMSLFDPQRIVDWVREEGHLPIVKVCSICHKVAWPIQSHQTWIEAEQYYQLGGSHDVRVSHGLCPGCSEVLAAPTGGSPADPGAAGGAASLDVPAGDARQLQRAPR